MNDLNLDPEVLRQTLLTKCGNLSMVNVQLEAAVQQLLTEKEMLEAERDGLQARLDETASQDT